MDFLPFWTVKRVILGALLVVLAAVQARMTWATLLHVYDPGAIPELATDVDPVKLTLNHLKDFTLKAGARKGDRLLAIDGRPAESMAVARRAMMSRPAGSNVTLRLQRDGQAPFDLTFAVPGRSIDGVGEYLVLIGLNIINPWSCIALGFWVALRRNGDWLSLAFLALLIGLSQCLKAEGALRATWGPLFTTISVFIDVAAFDVLVASWMWFAYLFPNPDSPHKVWPKAGWILGVPFIAGWLWSAVTTTATLQMPSAAAWPSPFAQMPRPVNLAWQAALVMLGFLNLINKLRQEKDSAARRRLRWLVFGLTLGVVPSISLVVAAQAFRVDLNNFPSWILTSALITPIFAPLTLAYAVLVDRIVDVGVFVRHGLLAARTISTIRAVLVFVLFWLVFNVASSNTLSGGQRWAGIVVCGAAIMAVRKMAVLLRGWVDRRFFREAVNSEHLLIELSDEVRRIQDAPSLLSTVTRRIGDALHVVRVVALAPQNGGFAPAFAYGVDGRCPEIQVPLSDPLIERLRRQPEPLKVEPQEASWGPLQPELLLPLQVNGELQGILSLERKRSDEPYSGQDVRLLESVANHTAFALENTRLAAQVAQEAALRERLNSELEIARDVQRRLFPKAAPKVAGLEIAGCCLPAQTIGGDYYDYVVTPSGEIGLAIGDVAGKGIPAALLMSGLQASLRALTLTGVTNLADLMSRLNRLVYDATPSNRFATFFFGLYNPSSRTLCFSSAGHNPTLLYRASTDEAIWLNTRGVGLGLSRAVGYQQSDVAIQPGDCLIFYTDGVTEARNSGEEEFGDARILATVRRCDHSNATEMMNAILDAVTSFAGGAPQHDDITLIVACAGERAS